MPDSNSQPILSHRPEARGFRVEQLLQEAKLGRLRIPSFQRPLRWRSKNVIDLFDSIRRGFPVGELLLSRAHAKAMPVHFGPVAIDAPEQHAALWVVDGQQRVTAMVAALMREEKTPRRDYWATWYDLENESFEVLTKKDVDPAWIPMNVLSDSVKQLKWIRDWVYAEEREDLVNRALELGKAIREYEIPAYIVEGVEEKALRLIFTRVNTGGIEMRESEIFEALYGQEGDKPIRSAVARLGDLGFGTLDEDLFLRCLRATCNPMLKDHVNLQDELPENAIHRTEAALRRAIQTITTWAGMPIFKLMPYRLPLYALSAFYDQFPGESTKVDRLVAKWIWRGAMSGDHENSSDARVAEIVSRVRSAESAEIAITELINSLGDFSTWQDRPNSPLNKLDQKISLKSAAAKIFILSLVSANPRRMGPETQIELFDTDETNDSDDASNLGEIDDRIYMPVVGNEKLGLDIVIRLRGMNPSRAITSDEYVLSSLFLNQTLVQHASFANIDEFRETRRTLISDYLQNFVADRIGDKTDIRPSINSIATSAVADSRGR